MLRLLRNFFKKAPRKRGTASSFRPSVERLEEREVPSVSGQEQLFIYLLNRARHDPAGYAQETSLPVGLTNVNPQPPLAVNNLLSNSSEFKSDEMADNDYFNHQSEVTGKWPNQLAREAGYNLPSYFVNNANYIESITYGWGQGQLSPVNTAAKALNGLLVDAGISPPGHRIHLLGMSDFADDFKEVGVGHEYRGGTRNTDYWTIHTGLINSNDVFLTGVAFNDLDGDGRYDANEGLGGVRIQAGGLETFTNAAGGWSLKVSPNSTYSVTASGAGYEGTSAVQASVGTANVEVDFVSGQGGAQVNFEAVGGLARPTVTGPAATTAELQPTITFSSVAGAAQYVLSLTNVATGAEVARVSELSSTSYTVTTPLAQGTYRVRVQAVDDQGDAGAWSSPRDFTVDVPLVAAPTVTAPATLISSQRPTITWTAPDNAVSYQLMVNNLTTGQKRVIDVSGLTGTSFTPDSDLAAGQYRVKVRAANAIGEAGTWSSVRDFRIKPVFKPTVTGPTASTNDRTPTFTWTVADGAEFYVLVVNNLTTGQKNVILVRDLTTTSFTPSTELTPGQYKVKVQGYKSNGLTGAFSAGVTFTIV